MPSPPADAGETIIAFLANAKEPVIVEPGQEPIPMTIGSYNIDRSGGRIYLEAWTSNRTLSRRITGVVAIHRNSVQFATERFGKREGVLELIDAAAPKAQYATRKATRHTYREQFRRSLLRQFPGWSITELSAEADLEHSLSPAYPRALLRKGRQIQAAIGCPADAGDVDAVLTFGLIWLDYLRSRDTKSNVCGLAVFVPQGRHRSTCLRLLHLRQDSTEWSAFVYTDRVEDKVDLRDYGNIDTVLPSRNGSVPAERSWWTEKLSSLEQVTAREEQHGRITWTVRGLEFARWDPDSGLTFGIDEHRKAREFHLAEIEALARELCRLRSSTTQDRLNPLYSRKPELWLEAQAIASLREIDASLVSAPVYRQAPAFAGGDRGILDLLAVDHSGKLVVVEVKASEDLHLPLQALDYWIRVRWHALQGDFRRLGYFPGVSLQPRPPRLILVAPALSFHPTTEAILDHFSPDISVDTVGVAMDWRDRVRVMFRKSRAPRP